jgi:alpha-maltose-1-phosphate synthase
MSVAREAVSDLPVTKARAIKIAVSHPHGNANSYHAALAFSESDWLHLFQTGVLRSSIASTVIRHLPPDIARRARNREFHGIPDARKKSHVIFEAVSRAGGKVRPGGLTSRINWYDVLFCGHDFQVSRSRWKEIDAVFAYEDAARSTFTAAKRAGATAIYELPLGYYRGVAEEINRARQQRPELQPEPYAEPSWKQRRKDAELELADVVVVASKWSKESLRWSDESANKPIITIPYGTPADEIVPRSQSPDGSFAVLFAGHIGLRKGVPHLIEAWEKLKLRDAQLYTAGSMNLPPAYLAAHAASFKNLGALPQGELLEVMKRVDLMVFPSLADGFGLVIGEAMACGIPVLTTTNTGGPELITDGVEGWCVSPHKVDPLIERLEWSYRNRQELYRMGQRARETAERWTWSDYRRRLIVELSPYLS